MRGRRPEMLGLLREVGLKRIELERERGGASLRIPAQEVECIDGTYVLRANAPLPVEDWNAQISLMTGMEAARLMIGAKVGILRTMPAPLPKDLEVFRLQAATLGAPWPADQPYGEFLRSLDLDDPGQLALMHHAASLFRGATYTVLDGEVPADLEQAAIGAPYAHTTAPLRRLVDRFSLLVCSYAARGQEVPAAVREVLPLLPKLMGSSNQLVNKVERAAIDTVEAASLAHRVGERFSAVTLTGTMPAPDGGGAGHRRGERLRRIERDQRTQRGKRAQVARHPAACLPRRHGPLRGLGGGRAARRGRACHRRLDDPHGALQDRRALRRRPSRSRRGARPCAPSRVRRAAKCRDRNGCGICLGGIQGCPVAYLEQVF